MHRQDVPDMPPNDNSMIQNQNQNYYAQLPLGYSLNQPQDSNFPQQQRASRRDGYARLDE